MAASSVPTQIAELVQTAHIKRNPSPSHDLNPSTAASAKEPVYLDPLSSQQQSRQRDDDSLDDSLDDDDDDEIPISVLRPAPRRGDGVSTRTAAGDRRRGRAAQLPPMPDLRFEQSYLHSIADAQTWYMVAWITMRDQVMMPLAQGVLYNLAVVGWQHWNRNAQLSGSSVGARVRRWWYGVNNWPLPPHVKKA